MPRQRRGAAPAATPARSAPTRPTAAPPRPAAAPQAQQQHQPHSTASHQPSHNQQAHPPQAPPQAQQGSSGPGLFGQMASTAAGVAVGSSIGHAIGGFFGGGSSAPAEPQQQAAPSDAQPMDSGLWQTNTASNSWENNAPCENDIRNFRKCMDDEQGNMSICGWYLDQLKACQAAAKPY